MRTGTMTDEDMAAAAERAADVQEAAELKQFGFRDGLGRLCTYSSLAAGLGFDMADVGGFMFHPAVEELAERFATFVGSPATSSAVCVWNNMPGRTSAEVVSTLRAFASALRAGTAPPRTSPLESMLTREEMYVDEIIRRAQGEFAPDPRVVIRPERKAKARPACFALV